MEEEDESIEEREVRPHRPRSKKQSLPPLPQQQPETPNRHSSAARIGTTSTKTPGSEPSQVLSPRQLVPYSREDFAVDLEASEDSIVNAQSPSGLQPTPAETHVENPPVYKESDGLEESLGSGRTADEEVQPAYSENGTCNEHSTGGVFGGVLTFDSFSCS